MTMPEKTLILMNMTYHHLWQQGMVNRNYHILRQLQSSGMWKRIISVDVLPISRSKIARVALSSRPWRKNTHTITRTLHYRIDVDPVFESTCYVSAYGVDSVLAALKEQDINIREAVVWSYDPFSAEKILDLKPAAFIFDAVDNWMEHPAYRQYAQRLEKAYETIREQASVIFTVSEGLVDFFHRRSNVFFVPNGVDYQHFQGLESNVQTQQSAHRNPVIVYHGVIQSRINFAIVEYLAQKHPEYQFHFIGPVWKDAKQSVKKLQKYPNVTLVGSVPYMRLPQALHGADCAIIPHKIDAFTHSMNPLKLYEYLAAGIGIVSTPVAGADQFQDLVRFAVSPEDFSREIQTLLAVDSPQLRERRMSMASQHGWERRFAVMQHVLKSQGVWTDQSV